MIKKKIKLVISDIDGTLVMAAKDALPSKKTVEAVIKLNKAKIPICLATARSLPLVLNIIEVLQLTGYVILHAGSVIYDINKKRVLWQRTMPKNIVKQVLNILSKSKNSYVSWSNNSKFFNTTNLPSGEANVIFCFGLLKNEVHKLKNQLSKIPKIHVSESSSWNGKEFADLVISHAQATKQYAVFELLKMMKIKRENVLGIGDRENDLPLLSACGTKVAMGNADKSLKEIADWVAPPIWEDGFTAAMEKFVL